MRVSVVVPTYCRPADILRCLSALERQILPADEVIVVVRDTDKGTMSALDERSNAPMAVRTVIVSRPGQVNALNAGLDAASGDIIAMTDDDAAPAPDWIRRIVATFHGDAEVGGVGGRDLVHHGHHGVEHGLAPVVGRVTWYGRTIGGHHLGAGAPREADFLKGANMSFRARAVAGQRFDHRLRGEGAQVHNDLAFCLAVKRAGWKLIYDPEILVDHFEAPRHDEDARGQFCSEAHRNRVYNETLTLLEYLSPLGRIAFLTIMVLVGTRIEPGLLQLVRAGIRRRPESLARWRAAQLGRLAGWNASTGACAGPGLSASGRG